MFPRSSSLWMRLAFLALVPLLSFATREARAQAGNNITVDTPGPIQPADIPTSGSFGVGGDYTTPSGGANNIYVKLHKMNAQGQLVGDPITTANITVSNPADSDRWSATLDPNPGTIEDGKKYGIVAELRQGTTVLVFKVWSVVGKDP